LTIMFVAGFGFDHMHRCSQRGRSESGLECLPPLYGQLTRCFSAVAELLVIQWLYVNIFLPSILSHKTTKLQRKPSSALQMSAYSYCSATWWIRWMAT